MTTSPGAPGRHAAPTPRDEGYDDWLSAPARATPQSGLPSGLGHVSGHVQGHVQGRVQGAAWPAPDGTVDDWATRRTGPAPAFEDAFASYSSQTGTHAAAHLGVPVPTHVGLRVAEQEPDAWPSVTFSPDPPAWEQPREEWDRPARSHRRTPEPRAGGRLHPVAFGLVGLLAGLALSLLVLRVVDVVFPTLLPSL